MASKSAKKPDLDPDTTPSAPYLRPDYIGELSEHAGLEPAQMEELQKWADAEPEPSPETDGTRASALDVELDAHLREAIGAIARGEVKQALEGETARAAGDARAEELRDFVEVLFRNEKREDETRARILDRLREATASIFAEPRAFPPDDEEVERSTKAFADAMALAWQSELSERRGWPGEVLQLTRDLLPEKTSTRDFCRHFEPRGISAEAVQRVLHGLGAEAPLFLPRDLVVYSKPGGTFEARNARRTPSSTLAIAIDQLKHPALRSRLLDYHRLSSQQITGGAG